ncbi:MAG: zf-HC2 domain-containing protein, partial [Deltaproteobacteria bacterium]|nr:zf-HC2 domain-containing protein [Deltaproteobacteria bacterium]
MAEARADCPNEEALAEFAAGALEGTEADSLEAHLDGCKDCAWLVGRLIGDHPSDPGTKPAHSVPEVRADRAARYLLREVVGAGGMGTVYEAEDVRLGRRVALKLLREDGPQKPGRAERFLREARITAMLEHPNIVPVMEVGELEDGAPYYTQRLVRGRTLARAIAGCRNLSERLRLLPHFRDLCNA